MSVILEEFKTPCNLKYAILNMEAADMTDESKHIRMGLLPFGQLLVPRHIDLAGNSLYYWDDIDYSRNKVDARRALDAFIRIKTPDDILRFARRYGPLGLCKHGLPPMHRGSWYQDVITDGELSGVIYTGEWNPAGGASERGWCRPCGNEPIEQWLVYSRLALSYLNFAASFKLNEVEILTSIGKLFLVDGINEWLGDAGIRLELNWDSQEPILILTGGGIFGALGVQMLMAVTKNTLTVCSGCGKPYLRKARKPKRGERNFCRDCGSKVASKLRQRDWQLKDKGGKSK